MEKLSIADLAEQLDGYEIVDNCVVPRPDTWHANDGNGEITAKMAGGPGMHKSTCNFCGGAGSFAVNKPADWAEPVKDEAKEEVAVA